MLETSIIVVYNSLHIALNVNEIQANNMVLKQKEKPVFLFI